MSIIEEGPSIEFCTGGGKTKKGLRCKSEDTRIGMFSRLNLRLSINATELD